MAAKTHEFTLQSYDLWKCNVPVIERGRRPEPMFSIGDEVEIPGGLTGPIVEREYDAVYGYSYCVLLVDPSEDGNDERDWYVESSLELV